MYLDMLARPELILDEARAKANLDHLLAKCRKADVRLRPHFKTHQSRAIGRWFREAGIDRIAVTNTGMARYFLEDGWTDITIAMPVNVREIATLADLSRHAQLGLMIMDANTVDILGSGMADPVSIWLKIDVGTRRTGLDPRDIGLIDQLVDRIAHYPSLTFRGFLAHAGHSYGARAFREVEAIHRESLSILSGLRSRYMAAWPHLEISLGDTPAAGMLWDFGQVDELRPGNFIFYDLMQLGIGACQADDIAVAMACPVIAVHPDRHQWVLHGGAIHFSKDHLQLADGRKCFGRMVMPTQDGWSTDSLEHAPFLTGLSQEHGIVQCTADTFQLARPGDMTLWLPVHSCLTADAMGGYVTTSGERVDHYRAHVNEQ